MAGGHPPRFCRRRIAAAGLSTRLETGPASTTSPIQAPLLDPLLEFTTHLRGTEFKNALAALQPGSELELEGPYGSFVLPADAGKVAFLAGGIGVTCVHSMPTVLPDSRSSSVSPTSLFSSG